MKVTSAVANKMLRQLNEELCAVMENERNTCVFNAAVGEDVSLVGPYYDFSVTQAKIADLTARIRKVKHAINVFNASTIIPELGMTIDEALIYIPQLTKEKSKLSVMAARLPRERVPFSYRGSSIIDYAIANYTISDAAELYAETSKKLADAQLALDKVNTTVEFELED